MLKTLRHFSSCSDGFSLLEMAVVLVIVSLMMGGLLVSLSQTQEINSRNDAERDLDEIAAALYGFAQATGRLPCPATTTSNGLESPVGGSTAGSACDQQHGFVPSATLGLSGTVNATGLFMDPWLSPYRYSVSTANNPANDNAYTSPNGISSATMTTMLNATDSLRVCDAAACAVVIADALPAVIMSLGADWDSFTAADVDATENSGEVTINGYRHGNDVNFVATGYIEDVFDDLIIWLSPSILFTRMISAGQLP